MPQNIIDLGFDVQAIQVQQAAVVTSLKQVYDYAIKIQDLKIGFRDSATGVVDFKKFNDELKRSNDLLIQQAKLNNENAKAQLTNAKAATENAKAKVIETKATDASNKSKVNERKINEDAANDYKQLSLAYRDAALKAKNYSLTLGANHPITLTAIADAKGMADQLLKIDQSVGQSQRNVGNYAKGFAGAFQKGFGFLRQAAAIIPGLGLSGIFLLGFEGISFVVKSLGLFSDKVKDSATAAKVLNDTLADGNGEYAKAIQNVDELRINIDLAKKGFLDKDKVVKEYNETVGKTTGQVKSLDEAEQQLAKNADAYIKFTLLKAAANVALGKAADETLQIEIESRKKASEFTSGLDGVKDVVNNNDVLSNIGRDTALTEAEKKQLKLEQRNRDEDKKLAAIHDKEVNRQQLEDIAKDFQAQAAKLAKDFNFNFFGDSGATKDAARTLNKALLEDEIAVRQSVADSDRFSQETRLAEAKKASALRIELINLEASYEIGKKDITTDEILKIETEAGVKRKNEAIKVETDLAKIRAGVNHVDAEFAAAKTLEEAKLKVAEDYEKKRLALDKSVDAAEDARIKDEMEIIKSGYAALLQVRQTQRTEEEAALIDQHNKGLIGEREFQKKMIAIQKEAAIDALKTTIAASEAQLRLTTVGTKAYDELKKAIASAKVELGKLADGSDDLAKLQKAFEKVAEIVGKVSDLITGAADIGYTKQSNALKDLSDQQEINYEREVARISDSSLAEQDKANKLKILEAQHQAQIEANDRKQRKLDNDRAKFQKAATIANLIAQTALAVVKALPDIGLAIAAGAIGAAEIAIAIATPVPHYAKGTANHPGGVALVGEGANAEIVNIPGRAPFVVDSPTYLDLPKHSSVKPVSSDELNAVMHRGMLIATADQLATMAAAQSQREGEAKAIAVWQTNELKKAFGKNSKRPSVHVHNDLGKQIEFHNYINRNIKGKA